jgi:hypothetical protein
MLISLINSALRYLPSPGPLNTEHFIVVQLTIVQRGSKSIRGDFNLFGGRAILCFERCLRVRVQVAGKVDKIIY